MADIVGRKSGEKLRLVYITGVGHVGSTLLELMLNAHPDAHSGGELKVVHEATFADAKHKCTCGRSASGCVFWSAVAVALEEDGYPSFDSFNTRGKLTPDEVGRNVAMLSAMAGLAGVRVLIDSSKSTDRLEALLGSPDIDLIPIVLYRDPRGQVRSEMRKRRSAFLATRRFIRDYRRILETVAGRPHVFLRYEDLVAAPEATLRALMPAIGLEYDPRQLAWAVADHHGLGGNRMRRSRSADTQVRADESWRTELSPLRRWFVEWSTRRVRADVAKSEAAYEVVAGSAAQVANLTP